MDILVIIALLLGVYVFSKIMLKEPILPWKEKKVPIKKAGIKGNGKGKKSKQKNKANEKEENEVLEEEEAVPFKELFPEIIEIDNHMIRKENNEFTMIAEVEPVNYFLKDPEEQEIVDVAFETWLAMINYPVRIYLQNRFIDLTEPIEEIQRTMAEMEDLNYEAREFGENMIRNLREWQRAQPRYETKPYILFDYKVDVKEIRADSEEELEEKIVDKAFNELLRRVQAANLHLRSGEMEVKLLTTEGIMELLYYTFNRRKALKNRFRDIQRQEQLSLYVTADQTPQKIARVKGELERYVQEESLAVGE